MSFGEPVKQFGGVDIKPFTNSSNPASLAGNGWRLSIDWDDYENGVKFADLLSKFLDTSDSENVNSLVIGCWDGAAEGTDSLSVVEALVSARERLPNLRHLFIGDILQEECETSWIAQTDISPLFLAFPDLVTLQIRGSEGLSLGRPVHNHLQRLILEGGGMPASVVNEVASGKLPQLNHLELWLGDDGYGRGVGPDELKPILDGSTFPTLTYLGLRNDREINETVKWLSDAAVIDRLDTLDLSLGALTDEGVAILAENPHLKSLKRLELFHHFASAEALAKLKESLPDVKIDTSDVQEADVYGDEVYYYNFVAE